MVFHFRFIDFLFLPPLKHPTHLGSTQRHFDKFPLTWAHLRPREQNCEVWDTTGVCPSVSGSMIKEHSNYISVNLRWDSDWSKMLEAGFLISEGMQVSFCDFSVASKTNTSIFFFFKQETLSHSHLWNAYIFLEIFLYSLSIYNCICFAFLCVPE